MRKKRCKSVSGSGSEKKLLCQFRICARAPMQWQLAASSMQLQRVTCNSRSLQLAARRACSESSHDCPSAWRWFNYLIWRSFAWVQISGAFRKWFASEAVSVTAWTCAAERIPPKTPTPNSDLWPGGVVPSQMETAVPNYNQSCGRRASFNFGSVARFVWQWSDIKQSATNK